MTMKGFKKCCIVNAMEGTNDMLWNGSEEDGDIIEYKEDEGTDYEDGGSDTDWTR
jgi:hypothetical protein